MARITVEDCVEVVSNRFELVILAAERAKRISSGETSTIAPNKNKIPVVALREIASGNIEINSLRELRISSLQKNNKMDEIEESNLHAEAQESFGEKDGYSNRSDDFKEENILDFSDESYSISDSPESYDDSDSDELAEKK